MFNHNINKAVKSFNEVFSNKCKLLSFLSIANKDLVLAWSSLNDQEQKIIDEAINGLIENAKLTESRKLQQAYFGSITEILLSTEINNIDLIINSDQNLLMFTQLVTIFLIRNDIDYGHSHDHIRESLKQKLKYFN